MALRVDSSGTDRITRNDNPTGACSAFFFFRPAVVNRIFDVLFYAGDSAASTYENGVMLMFGDFGSRLEVWCRSTAFVFQASAGQALSANTWYWVGLSYNTGDSQSGNLYCRAIGGTTELGGSFTSGSAGTAVSEVTEFGSDPTGDNAAQTRIAGARMWNAQLTEAEFLREATSLTAVRRRDLWGGWTFQNDGLGLTDYSGNGRNLTETGTVTVEDGPPGIPMSRWAPIRLGASAAGADNDIVAAGALSITGAAILNATGALVAAGSLSIAGAADLDGAGSLAAAGSVSISGAADLDAAGSLVAAGALSISGSADLDAIGSLSAAGVLAITGAADLGEASANDILAAGGLSITGAAALTAVGQLAAAGSIAIDGSASLESGVEPAAPEESFSGGLLYDYEREQARRRRERKRRRELEEESERIEDATTREIARFLREQEAKDARRAELQRLSQLVDAYVRRIPEAELSPRVNKAIVTVTKKGTNWSLFQLERELARAKEEEDFVIQALRIAIEND